MLVLGRVYSFKKAWWPATIIAKKNSQNRRKLQNATAFESEFLPPKSSEILDGLGFHLGFQATCIITSTWKILEIGLSLWVSLISDVNASSHCLFLEKKGVTSCSYYIKLAVHGSRKISPTNQPTKEERTYLEPKWPLFLNVNTTKQGLNFNQNIRGPMNGF